jgi:uncharacterized Zn-binding protein involved in type VI secretion
MGSNVACVGDKTTHGGTIVTGNEFYKVQGKAAAQLGDLVPCPKCGGSFPIVTSQAPQTVVYGRPLAYHGDKLSCGAVIEASAQLFSSSPTTQSTGSGSGSAGVAVADTPAPSSTLCLECLQAAAANGASTVSRG